VGERTWLAPLRLFATRRSGDCFRVLPRAQ
jgi:hypothetical protein